MASRWNLDGVAMASAWNSLGLKRPSFARVACRHASMSDDSSRVKIRKRQVVAFRGRGAIYNWLRAHHAKVAELLEGERATWPDLCAEMIRHGVSDRGGDEPAPNAASKVWKRVCRDAPDEPRPVNRFNNYPSRISKDWRPSGFREEVPSPGTAVVPVTPSEMSFRASLGLPPKTEKVIRTVLAEGEVLSDEEVDAEMDRMTAKLNGRKAG